MKMKVTVIIPCYNLEKYIEKCICSICNQSYKDLEIMVVNDGSTDNSWSIITSLMKSDYRIKGINQNNLGVSAARNRGISESTGEMIMFVDGDDYIENDYIEKMMDGVNENIDMVIAGLTFKYPTYDSVVRGVDFNCSADEFFEKYYLKTIIDRTIFGPVNKLYRKSILRNNNIKFIDDFAIREDGLFVLEYLKYVNYLTGIKDAGYYYIQHQVGTSLVGKFQEYELFANSIFFDSLLNFFKGATLKKEIIKNVYPMFLNMDFTSIMKFYSSSGYTKYNGIKYIKKVIKDKDFRKARKELIKVDFKKGIKYYRPVIITHFICSYKRFINNWRCE